MSSISITFSTGLSSMPDSKPFVYVVDDDISVRESLELLITQAGWRPEVFSTAEDFLAHSPTAVPSCLLLDLSLPNLNGLELQKRIAGDRTEMPIIFITGHADIPATVQAMKAGAVEFLTKPFTPDVLLNAICGALERSRISLDQQVNLQKLRDRHQSLSQREQEVMALVVQGRLNKQIGAALGISEITVKAHRGRVMRKMRAKSLPDLVNMAARLGLATAGEK